MSRIHKEHYKLAISLVTMLTKNIFTCLLVR